MSRGLLVGTAAGPLLGVPDRSVGASRSSRVTRGTVLLHADLHNHTLLSDGRGDPAAAFASMRRAGLDAAALTDHTVNGATRSGTEVYGMDRDGWERTGALADAHDEPGSFTALRGFEWSHPRTGHVNAWFTDDFTDIASNREMPGLLDWVVRSEALAGFNHPGREPGRFAEFTYAPAAHDRIVSLELFNRTDDFLFEGVRAGHASPLVACLAAGWRPGLLGTSDEHGDDWGFAAGKGRGGLWVTEHSRAGVAEALRARRFFATRVPGLRVDAAAGGVRMGSVLRHRRGPVTFALDVDGGPSWQGTTLEVQVLRPDPQVPAVVDVVPVRCGSVARFTVPLDVDDGGWVVLRIADPEGSNLTPGPPGHAANNAAVAYLSPWYLQP